MAKSGLMAFRYWTCSHSFDLTGLEYILPILRKAAGHGRFQMIGRVLSMTGRYSKGRGIPGALVTAEGSEGTFTTRTEEDGHYVLSELPNGKYKLRVSRDSFL